MSTAIVRYVFVFLLIFVTGCNREDSLDQSMMEASGKTPSWGERVERTDDEWRRFLSPERYRVLRMARTERAYTSELLHNKRHGVYRCAGCNLALFDSRHKYESGTGWPSYWEVISQENIQTKVDRRFGMRRVEALCARCGSHLGHVFEDGPPPTGLRYCINGLALEFSPAATDEPRNP